MCEVLTRINSHTSHLTACPHGFACPEDRWGLYQSPEPWLDLQGSSSDPANALLIVYKKLSTCFGGKKRLHHQLAGMSRALGVQQDYDNSHKIHFRPQEQIQELMRSMCSFPSTAGRAIQVSTEINCC